MLQRMNEIIRDKFDNGGPIQFLDRSERGGASSPVVGGRSFMAAANRFLGANHTDAAAIAAVHLKRRRRSYGSNSGGGGGSINAIVASFARSTVSRANAAKCQGPSVASVASSGRQVQYGPVAPRRMYVFYPDRYPR